MLVSKSEFHFFVNTANLDDDLLFDFTSSDLLNTKNVHSISLPLLRKQRQNIPRIKVSGAVGYSFCLMERVGIQS